MNLAKLPGVTAGFQMSEIATVILLKDLCGVDTFHPCRVTARIIACIQYPLVIDNILSHLNEQAAAAGMDPLPQMRAPPQPELFD